MRKYLLIVCTLFLFVANSHSQNTEVLRVKGSELPYFMAKEGYRYPTFRQARVYFNNGDSAGGKLNYNNLLQSMQFVGPQGDTLVIANQNTINYISVGLDSFFYDNGWYEWVASSATARLGVKHALKTAGAQKLGAFGIPVVTSKVQSEDMISDVHPEKLEINEEIIFTKQTSYYISGIKGHFVEANKRNMARLFPKKDIDTYVKENRLNLNKEQGIVDLFVFVSKTH